MNGLDRLVNIWGAEKVTAAFQLQHDAIQFQRALFAYYDAAYSGRLDELLSDAFS